MININIYVVLMNPMVVLFSIKTNRNSKSKNSSILLIYSDIVSTNMTKKCHTKIA